jgi:uncharacterized protein (DUF1501 family)
MQRRDFLKFSGLIPLTLAVPNVFAQPATLGPWQRVLVLVELEGGNDGLNTVVPYSDPQYYQVRSQLAVARQSVLQLSPQLGFNPALEPLMPAWQARELALVLGVGYPQPNRSHFRSIEIWDTASGSEQVLQTGWLAQLFATTPPPASLAADGIVLDSDPGPLGGQQVRTVVLRDPQRFLEQARRVKRTVQTTTNPALTHLLTVQNDLHRAAAVLEEKLTNAPALAVTFPPTRLGRQLQTAAHLLIGHTPVAVIKVSHGSFDTHSNQRQTHDRLLRELAEALMAFRQAMQSAGRWSQVLLMTYSEFGRRPAENGSAGTDHGTAAPHFFLGGTVKGGLHGQQPALTDLAQGDLRHTVDYRSLYTTVVRRWWGLAGGLAQNQNFPVLDCLA